MPEFARYTVFGQHFAGFGPDVFRLDRHPSMVRHPTTPAYEADIRALLASQECTIEHLVDVRALPVGVALRRSPSCPPLASLSLSIWKFGDR